MPSSRWTYTMDSDHHVTLFENGRIVWEGSYEALCADGDARPPARLLNQIHAQWERENGIEDEQDDGGDRPERSYRGAELR